MTTAELRELITDLGILDGIARHDQERFDECGREVLFKLSVVMKQLTRCLEVREKLALAVRNIDDSSAEDEENRIEELITLARAIAAEDQT